MITSNRRLNERRAIKRWIENDFADNVLEECSKQLQLALLKVGYDQGDDIGKVMATFVSSVVLAIAGLEVVESSPDEHPDEI